MGWKPYDAMSRIEKKMYRAVREEAMLHELPWPEIDDPGGPREVRWPAEDPSECTAILLTWFDAGLIAPERRADGGKERTFPSTLHSSRQQTSRGARGAGRSGRSRGRQTGDSLVEVSDRDPTKALPRPGRLVRSSAVALFPQAGGSGRWSRWG